MTDVLIIDWSNLLYRAGHAGKTELRDPVTGRSTNTFHYSLRMLETYLQTHRPRKVLLALDNPYYQYARRSLWPEYKARRKEIKKNNPEFSRMVDDIRDMNQLLRHLPVYYAFFDTLEADDVIAWASYKLWPDASKLIVSTDKDMLQLVNPSCTVLYPGKKERLITPQTWAEHLSQLLKLPMDQVPTIEQYVDYKCIVGETGPTSDNVPGIKSYGAVKAAALLTKYGSFQKAVQALQATQAAGGKLGELEKRLLEPATSDIIKRNRLLMDLRVYLTEEIQKSLRFFSGTWNPAVLDGFLQQWSLAKLYGGPLSRLLAGLVQ